MVADADAGVVGVVVVIVDDRGFVRGGELAAVALPMLSERLCPSSLSVFIQLPLNSRWKNWPCSARYWDYGQSFLGVRGGVMNVQSPCLYLCLLQFRFLCRGRGRVRVRIQVQRHCSFGPFILCKGASSY
jgi:hypothetical protein